MKVILGFLLILAGIVLGLYVGVWLMFVGGIIAIVDAVQADPVSGSAVAWGIVRIIFASFVGYLASLVLIVPGIKISND